MNDLFLSMFVSAILSGTIATMKDRSVILWTILSVVGGPIALAVIICLPSRKVATVATPVQSLADEIGGIADLRDRGVISDAEFALGKAQILAQPVPAPARAAAQPRMPNRAAAPVRSIVDEIHGIEEQQERGLISNAGAAQRRAEILARPVPSAIPSATPPTPTGNHKRATWDTYQPAVRAGFASFATQHGMEILWREEPGLEIACVYPIQPRLSFAINLGLEKGTIHVWGEGWVLDNRDLPSNEVGLPSDLHAGLNALVEGNGRLVIRTAFHRTEPFWVSLQIYRGGRWRTAEYQGGIPFPPIWRSVRISNRHDDHPGSPADSVQAKDSAILL
ncbi:SHOCT domain-containing protein [Sphingomonas montana]|uniref:SHOCT domain-containing protein n=1 Tax=Sphingomonas montana TaxID=1843236 RepID=UPI00096F64A9|nr:SHOCT domain-containing protein [Sphingomonas montana]